MTFNIDLELFIKYWWVIAIVINYLVALIICRLIYPSLITEHNELRAKGKDPVPTELIILGIFFLSPLSILPFIIIAVATYKNTPEAK